MVNSSATLILDAGEIQQKIRRIAFQLWENNLAEKQVFLAGIDDRGYAMAEALKKQLDEIAGFDTRLARISINKENPSAENVKIDVDPKVLKDQVIIVTDDVLNTGKTIIYAMTPLLNAYPKKIETAFLVNRSHKSFPVAANYTGLELSTTIKNHIKVDFSTVQVFLVDK